MRFGIFGGTFNPIHFGHLRAAEEVRYKAGLDKIIFMPSGIPPLKSEELVDAYHRYKMVRIATSSNPDFLVSDIEIRGEEISYTLNTVEKMKRLYPEDELFFILGTDAFLDMPNWYKPDLLIEMIDFILVTRPGYDLFEIIKKSPFIRSRDLINTDGDIIDLSLLSDKKISVFKVTDINISSTEIRRLLRENRSIRYLLPEPVEEYIYRYKLY
jgi:nicotinate-nucleotide adenylyltransferase